jgi:hypothetical protein
MAVSMDTTTFFSTDCHGDFLRRPTQIKSRLDHRTRLHWFWERRGLDRNQQTSSCDRPKERLQRDFLALQRIPLMSEQDVKGI